ncbi:MAG: Ig-like domain-containing protein [Planctomycetes bacterium]|nr:Ig-like domain-containing protein [Planctomycetota bacterium]
MSVRPPIIALVLALAGLAGCGGGEAKVGQASFSCTGTDARAICLVNCNLGCSSTGCQRTNIAQNEVLILQFSEPIDPASVNSSSIRLRTAGGEPPVGQLFVNGSMVEFIPTLSITGGQTFYGFTPGETYTLTIPGGPDQIEVVRSTSGKPFERTLTCTLQSTLGIVDLNGVPPSATLTSPPTSQLQSAPRELDIVLEFNELIDATPFLSGTASPVAFSVRRTRLGVGGERECDPNSAPVALTGSLRLDFDPARSISILTFRPAGTLPGNVCVQITVTNGVQDLSGRPAASQVFTFLTEVVPTVEGNVTEDFLTDAKLEVDASAGSWGAGYGRFARIGGDARHGAFSTSIGIDDGPINGKRQFTINTDSTIIPATNTYSGAPVAVTDGRFAFTQMVVPSDVRLRFIGSVPPVLTVAGRLDILGEIDIAGGSVAPPAAGQTGGQVGGTGGIFGGNGGQGGDRCGGFGVPLGSRFSGNDGQAARVAGAGAYTGLATSGGRGSSLFPTDGLSSSLIYPTPLPALAYSPSAAAGGGGGGLWQAGGQGRVVSNNHNDPVLLVPPRLDAMGPPAAGGTAVTLFPFTPTLGNPSALHFLVGGAGGGGAGSHACLALHLVRTWSIGGGGGGGGGAIALRAGHQLRLAPGSLVRASGGSVTVGPTGITTNAQPAPGGGGSGGSVVLQSGNLVEVSGVVDVRGGTGGVFNRFANGSPNVIPNSASVQIAGGDGSPGFVRLEAPGNPPTTLLASMLPPPVPQNVGTLLDRDDLVSVRSLFYSTGLLFGPEYERYEIYAEINGVPVVFSDDPAVSNTPAQQGAALRVLFQAATLDPVTGLPTEVRPWRTSVRTFGNQTGIASDGLTAFRFALLVDQTLVDAEDVRVDRVVVYYLTST